MSLQSYSFCIKFHGLLRGRYKSGYINPERGEFEVQAIPTYFINDKETAYHIAAIYNNKQYDADVKYNYNKYTVVQIFKVQPKSKFCDYYWEREV